MGELCTGVRVSLEAACFPIKREEEDKQEKNGRNEAAGWGVGGGGGRGRNPHRAPAWTNHSAALMEQQLYLSSPRREQIERCELSRLHNPAALCRVCGALASKTQDGVVTRLCNRCTCASRLSSRPSEQFGRALDLTPTAARTKRVCACTGSFRSVDLSILEKF